MTTIKELLSLDSNYPIADRILSKLWSIDIEHLIIAFNEDIWKDSKYKYYHFRFQDFKCKLRYSCTPASEGRHNFNNRELIKGTFSDIEKHDKQLFDILHGNIQEDCEGMWTLSLDCDLTSSKYWVTIKCIIIITIDMLFQGSVSLDIYEPHPAIEEENSLGFVDFHHILNIERTVSIVSSKYYTIEIDVDIGKESINYLNELSQFIFDTYTDKIPIHDLKAEFNRLHDNKIYNISIDF